MSDDAPVDGGALGDQPAVNRFQSEAVRAILVGMAGTVAASHFVGRAAELDRLHAAFESARTGDPVTLCVGGEAGVGKTRLVTRFAEQVKEAGGRVLLGACIELGEGSLPYGPLIQAFRGLGQDLEPAALADLVAAERAMLARMLPELGPTMFELAMEFDPSQYGEADRREVDPPVEVQVATWSPAGTLD